MKRGGEAGREGGWALGKVGNSWALLHPLSFLCLALDPIQVGCSPLPLPIPSSTRLALWVVRRSLVRCSSCWGISRVFQMRYHCAAIVRAPVVRT